MSSAPRLRSLPDRLRQIALFELGGLLLLLSALLGAPAHGQALPIPIGTEASLPFAAAAELFSETGSRRDVAEVAQSAAFRPLALATGEAYTVLLRIESRT